MGHFTQNQHKNINRFTSQILMKFGMLILHIVTAQQHHRENQKDDFDEDGT